jgi:mRNA interferase HigB
MHVITATRLRTFWMKHADAESPLRSWLRIVEARPYAQPGDVQRDFAAVSFLGRRCTVFNIGGNKYRLVVDMRYDLGRIYIRHVLTHGEYDRLIKTGELCSE